MLSITLNGKAVMHPGIFLQNILATGGDQFIDFASRATLAGLCNRYSKTTGPNSSYGYFAVTREIVDALGNNDVELVMKVGSDEISQSGLRVVRATGMAPIEPDNKKPGDAFVVELADRRILGNHPWLKLDNRGQKIFNIPAPAYSQDAYYIESMDDTLGAGSEVSCSWQYMLDEVWPSWLGASPEIPTASTPSADPVGFDFRCHTAYQAVNIILSILNLHLNLESDGTFSLIDFGEIDSDTSYNDQLRNKYKSALDESIEFIEPSSLYYPKGVTVHFPKTSTQSGSENTLPQTAGQWYTDMEHTIDVDATAAMMGTGDNISDLLDDSYQQIWDDMPAWVDFDGTVLNTSDLTTRANERASSFYLDLIKRQYRFHDTYSNLVPFRICGTLQAVAWSQCLRRGGAFLTEIFCHPRRQMVVSGGELVPATVHPESPWQWRSMPIYPQETAFVRITGAAVAGVYPAVEVRENGDDLSTTDGIDVGAVNAN